MLSPNSRQLAYQIRQSADEMANQERALLRVRKSQENYRAGLAISVITLGSCAALIFVSFAGVFIRRTLDALARSLGQSAQFQAILAKRSQVEAERFKTFVEDAPEAIAFANEQGEIIFANSRMEKMFGYKSEDLLGRPVEDLIPLQYRSKHVRHRGAYNENPVVRPKGVGLDLVGLRKDGVEFPVEVSLGPVETDQGVLTSTVISDITERKRMERELVEGKERLARSNAELEQFAYVASHDLQEPLRMVASYLQLLAQRYKGKLGSDADDFINFAVDGATRMKTLIQDLLAYSRAGRGKPLERVEMARSLDRALFNLAMAIEESGASVSHDPLPEVMADEWQLTELFQNLIGNAIKFHGSNPPRVHIGAKLDDREWVISVRDNGIGIEPQYRDRIFVIFQRLHGREEYPGTGIGLAICKKIVTRLGGRLWVDSQPGQGSTFSFTIPAPPNAEQEVQEEGRWQAQSA